MNEWITDIPEGQETCNPYHEEPNRYTPTRKQKLRWALADLWYDTRLKLKNIIRKTKQQ